MAVVIPLADVDEEKVRLITEALTLIPIDPQEEQQKKWGRAPAFTTPRTPIVMYTVEGSLLRLPYRFACGLFGHIFNADKDHLHIREEYEPPFVGMLRSEQIAPATEAYEQLQIFGTTTLGLEPGAGKTYCGIWLAYMLGLMFVIIVPRETLVLQWLATIITCVPALADNIWMPGINEPPTSGIPAGIIALDTRVEKIPDEYRRYVGTLIVDEAHMLCTPTRVDTLLSFEPQYIIMETATLERDDGLHSMVQAIAGTHGVFKVATAPYTVIRLETEIKVEDTYGQRGRDFGDLCKKLAESEDNNAIVLDIVRTNPHRKYIILTKLADHATQLKDWFNTMGITADTMTRSKKSYVDSTVLVGTMPKIGTGFDEQNSCPAFKGRKSDVLILFHSVKRWQSFEQFRGRVMRSDNPIVVWMHGKNVIPRNHLRDLLPWIAETNGTVIPMAYSVGGVHLAAITPPDPS